MANKSGFIKVGEASFINLEKTESCVPSVNSDMLEKFRKTAAELKKVAPKAEDFLYFSAVMMHAAESAAINDDGTPKLNSKGEAVKVGWDKSDDTWRWTSNDPSIKPYKNCNGDIFPELELIKAHKKWIHKPLCIDHKSSSVDHTRGFIVDTYYDHILKRVVALCALDKANYPDLAKKVSSLMQTNVSMGTAVGRAICTDCARVAKTEADFCDHMRKKSCYGEINVDLNPIELSIVVNGADPKANIKHIIASANTMQTYVENKANELKKIASNYVASLSFADNVKDGDSAVTNISVSSKDLETFRKDVDKAISEFEELQSSLNEEEKILDHTNDLASNKSESMDEGAESGLDDLGLAPPHERYASADVEEYSIEALHKVTASIRKQLWQMKQSLDKLEKASTNKQEENMSGSNEMNKKGYFQGTEEPTPGQVKYPADPLNEKLRTDGDKQMEGEAPFPGVGPVDGLHPGDLERKKMLARAAAEERAVKRAEIVNLAKDTLKNKMAYFQNGEGPNNPNTPTPGKVKYPADKTNEQVRDREDKQMVGKKPFPGVGSTTEMYPEDKKVKELHSRASLRARFVKASNQNGTQNLSKSAWEVFLGDKLLLTASVGDLTHGRNDIDYNNIATKEFGAKLIESVKTFGSDGVKSLIKKAQEAPQPAPAPAPQSAPAQSAMPEAGPMPEDLLGDESVLDGKDTGDSGDPKSAALKLSEKVRDLSSDLVEAIRALAGEQAEMGEVDAVEPVTASFNMKAFNSTRRELNEGLYEAMKESVAQLNDHAQELEMISGMYDNGAMNSTNEDAVNLLVQDSLADARVTVANGFGLMTAFVKYARGTKAMVKRAELEQELNKLSEGDEMSDNSDLMSLISETDTDLEDAHDLMNADSEDDSDDSDDLDSDDDFELGDDDSADDLLDEADADVSAKKEELAKLTVNPGDTVKVTAGFESKAERAAMRSKLAAETLKWSPMLDQAHPKGGFTTDLDVKSEGDLAKVEDLQEVNDAMMGVATAPPKVRKEAEAIHKLVSEGKLDPSDLDALVAEGLDKDAVAYWKKFYSQVDGGSEFASELVKEHVKAELETELNTYKVKLARAYELAYEMVDRGLCSREAGAIADQVDAIVKFNNENFETLKRVVARHAPVMQKQASGKIPNVGLLNDGEINGVVQSDDYAQLSSMFSKGSKRGAF